MSVRAPAVAGLFYPEDVEKLVQAVAGFLEVCPNPLGNRLVNGHRTRRTALPLELKRRILLLFVEVFDLKTGDFSPPRANLKANGEDCAITQTL